MNKAGNTIADQGHNFFASVQVFLVMLYRVEVQRVVHRQRHLVGNKREKANFLPAIGIGLYAAHCEAPEAPLRRRQRKGAYRTNTAVLEHLGYSWESGLRL